MIFQIIGKKRGDMERMTRSEQKEERLKRDRGGFPKNIDRLSTRGRNSCYSRPKVALLAAASSTNCGRE